MAEETLKHRLRSSSKKAPQLANKKHGNFSLRTLSGRHSGSLLMTMLPAEIRLRIWELAVGGKTIHPYDYGGGRDRDTKMACAVCPIPDAPMQYLIGRACAAHHDEHYGVLNVKTQDSAGNYPMTRCRWEGFPGHVFRPLPLLQSCRAIHKEASPILYHSTTFAFYSLTALVHFVRLVPTHHLSQIRRLILAWTLMKPLHGPPPASPGQPMNEQERSDVFDRITWAMACRSIMQMTGLRALTVKLFERPRVMTGGSLRIEWPAELRMLRPLSSFDVIYECSRNFSSPELRPALVQRAIQSFGDIPFRVLVPDYQRMCYITLEE